MIPSSNFPKSHALTIAIECIFYIRKQTPQKQLAHIIHLYSTILSPCPLIWKKIRWGLTKSFPSLMSKWYQNSSSPFIRVSRLHIVMRNNWIVWSISSMHAHDKMGNEITRLVCFINVPLEISTQRSWLQELLLILWANTTTCSIPWYHCAGKSLHLISLHRYFAMLLWCS